MAVTKKNPADQTKRNTDARKKVDAALWVRLRSLETFCRTLATRVRICETELGIRKRAK